MTGRRKPLDGWVIAGRVFRALLLVFSSCRWSGW